MPIILTSNYQTVIFLHKSKIMNVSTNRHKNIVVQHNPLSQSGIFQKHKVRSFNLKTFQCSYSDVDKIKKSIRCSFIRLHNAVYLGRSLWFGTELYCKRLMIRLLCVCLTIANLSRTACLHLKVVVLPLN